MADLNVALILRLVDRLSAPARGAARALGQVATAEKAVGKESRAASAAVDKLENSAGRVGGTITKAAGATVSLTTASRLAATGAGQLGYAWTNAARAAEGGARSQTTLARELDKGAAAADRQYRTFSRLERAQMRSGAATRVLGGEFTKLDRGLGTLAKLQIATMGLDQLGRGLGGTLRRAVSNSASWTQGMTGIGVTADLSDRELAPVQSHIYATARMLGMRNERTMAAYGAVLNEGVYRSPKDLMTASRSVAGFQKLAETAGDPMDDAAMGSLVGGLASNLNLKPQQLESALAKVFRSAQLGGVTMGVVGRSLPEMLGLMKGFGADNDAGFTDLLAALQVTKKSAGDPAQAAIYAKDFLSALAQKHTRDRFAKAAGIDLPNVIAAGNRSGVSPIASVLTAVSDWVARQKKTGTAEASIDQFLMSKLLINQQSASALRALVQNRAAFDAQRRDIARNDTTQHYEQAKARVASTPEADYERLANARSHLSKATGDILVPAARVGAGVLGGAVNALTRMQEQGGPLGKVGAFAAAGVAGLALGLGVLSHAAVAVLTPIVTLRFLLRAIPLSTEAAKGPLLSLGSRVLPVLGSGLRPAAGAAVTFGLRAVPAMLAFSAALLTNPITWIVAGVVGLAAAGFLIWKNWRPISAFFVRMWGGVRESFGSALGWIGGLAARFAGMGGNLMGGLVRGILGALGAMKGAIAHAAGSVVQWFKDRLGIRSPSRVFATLGGYSMEGLARGFTAGIPHAGRAARLASGRVALAAAAGLMVGDIASAAAAHARPPSYELTRSAPPSTASERPPVELRIYNTFNVQAEKMDVRDLARQLNRLEAQNMRRALNDGWEHKT